MSIDSRNILARGSPGGGDAEFDRKRIFRV